MTEVKSKRGLKKGQTNNPNGRPVGSTNKVSRTLKEQIASYSENDFPKLIEQIDTLDPKDMVKAKLELLKLVVARPLSDEEKDGVNKLYGGLAHLFGKKDDTEE
jgi:hypothetical protein